MSLTGKIIGKNCYIEFNGSNVLGMGQWSITGTKADLIDATEFGDQFKIEAIGLQDGGEVTFSGDLVITDPSQQALVQANLLNSQLTNMAFMVNAVSGYKLNLTSYPNSYLLVTSWKVDADKSGLAKNDFTMKVNGGPLLLQ